MATVDSVPIVDLRLLSQSEIKSLALSSPNAFNLDTLSDVVPKIDRSVFNESAGSRKQTYSRLPLFQSQPQPQIPQPQPQSQPPNPALPRRRGRPRLHPLPAPGPAPGPGPAENPATPDFGRKENPQIVSILKKLFESREKCSSNGNDTNSKIKNGNKSIVVFSDVDTDREVRNDNPNTIDPSSGTVISAIEKCNGDQKVCEEHHLIPLSGNGPSYGVETYASDIVTSKEEEHGELDTSIDDKIDAGSCQTLTNKDTGIASTMHNELNTSYIFINIASEPSSGIETNADCMFPGDLNKSLLEEGIHGVGNELQNYFHSSNVCVEDAAGIIMSNGDEEQALQVSVADQSSSWAQSSNNLPILDLIPDQCQDELRGTVPRNEQANLSGSGELRLGNVEPAADFVLFAGQASETSGSVTRSPMELFPDNQLERGTSLNNTVVTPNVGTSVCVWCSREFSLEGVESEPQSESLGYMCPDCRSKISGQLGLLNNGFS